MVNVDLLQKAWFYPDPPICYIIAGAKRDCSRKAVIIEREIALDKTQLVMLRNRQFPRERSGKQCPLLLQWSVLPKPFPAFLG